MPLVENNWPQEVTLPDTIGKHKFYINNKPHCSIGHLQLVLPRGGPEEKRWRRMFRVAAEYVLKLAPATALFCASSCERINDDFTQDDEQRALLYAVTWALCDYDIHGYPEATKVAAAITALETP